MTDPHPHSVSRRARRGWMAVLVLLSGSLGGCTFERPSTPKADHAWVARAVPQHPGLPGRRVYRDATRCEDAWWLVGAVYLDEPSQTRDTRPAAWSSTDGVRWVPVTIRTTTYWGRRAILNSVACSRGRVVTVGARSGGAHGNPRVTTFKQNSDRSLVDVPAVFTQYGGVTATGVGPITGGPEGWLIAGNRLSGPGVWVTDDPSRFTKIEGEPALTGPAGFEAIAQSGAWDGEGWTLIGGGAQRGSMADRDPAVWTSSDGLRWAPEDVPSSDRPEDMHRAVLRADGRLQAVGLSGDAFASWTRTDEGWQPAVEFGRVATTWRGTPYVASTAITKDELLATVSTGDSYQLWSTPLGESDWHRLSAPMHPTTASDHTLIAATNGDQVLLVCDDGTRSGVWTSESRDDDPERQPHLDSGRWGSRSAWKATVST